MTYTVEMTGTSPLREIMREMGDFVKRKYGLDFMNSPWPYIEKEMNVKVWNNNGKFQVDFPSEAHYSMLLLKWSERLAQ